MLVVIDIGNTNIVVGMYENGAWMYEWRMETDTGTSYACYQKQLQKKIEAHRLNVQLVKQAILSSVVPALTGLIGDLITEVFGRNPMKVGPDIYPYLPIDIPSSSEMGTDLVANAMAAITRFPNQTCIVIDFGTALTFTTLSKEGQFLGVAIAPGIKTTMKALFLNAAQLPEIPLVVPDLVIGTNTSHAIQSGILIGFEGLVGHLLRRHREELKEDCVVIATGGLSGVLESLNSEYDLIDRKLTLDGLRIIAGYIPDSI